jgi:hypothetical protein
MSDNQPQVIVIREKGIGCMGMIFWAVIAIGVLGVIGKIINMPPAVQPTTSRPLAEQP